jgi:hypothetical protein
LKQTLTPSLDTISTATTGKAEVTTSNHNPEIQVNSHNSESANNTLIISVSVVVGVLLIIASSLFTLFMLKKRKQPNSQLAELRTHEYDLHAFRLDWLDDNELFIHTHLPACSDNSSGSIADWQIDYNEIEKLEQLGSGR